MKQQEIIEFPTTHELQDTIVNRFVNMYKDNPSKKYLLQWFTSPNPKSPYLTPTFKEVNAFCDLLNNVYIEEIYKLIFQSGCNFGDQSASTFVHAFRNGIIDKMFADSKKIEFYEDSFKSTSNSFFMDLHVQMAKEGDETFYLNMDNIYTQALIEDLHKTKLLLEETKQNDYSKTYKDVSTKKLIDFWFFNYASLDTISDEIIQEYESMYEIFEIQNFIYTILGQSYLSCVDIASSDQLIYYLNRNTENLYMTSFYPIYNITDDILGNSIQNILETLYTSYKEKVS